MLMIAGATKQQRRKLRELASLAHDRELARELAQLEVEFSRWRSQELDVHELNDRIHQFHQGPSRKLYSFYSDADLDLVVARAIVRNIISEDEAGPEVVQMLSRVLESARLHLDVEESGG